MDPTPPDPQSPLVGRLVKAAVYYLSLRPRSTQEVSIYLHRKTKHEPSIQAAIQKISHFNLLNDQQFACDWASNRVRQGKGPIIIRLELHQKGVNESQIDQALSQIPLKDWIASAQAYLTKKNLTLDHHPTPLQRNQAVRALYGRGFPVSILRHLID